ncbi:MAG: hypothetical protein IPK17_29470 [Chloroflexi bacterium]|nr:hypothetical protein [Chloroflexota bacterium]
MTMQTDISAVNFNRPPRTPTPQLPDLTVDIPAPPPNPPPPEQNLLIILLPTIGIGLISAFYFIRSLDTGAGLWSALPLLALLLFTVGSSLWLQNRRRREYRVRREEARIAYIRLLGRKQARLQAAHDAYRAILETDFPAPNEITSIVLTRADQLWQRRPSDHDFLSLRIGTGRIPSPVVINAPDVEDLHADFDLSFLHAYQHLEAAPVVTALPTRWALGVCGARAARLNWARVAVQHLVGLHAPQELHLHLLARGRAYEDWRWLEWLPHVSQSHRGGAADLLAFDDDNSRRLLTNLNQLIEERREQRNPLPYLVILVDGDIAIEADALATLLRRGASVGAAVIWLGESLKTLPGECNAVIELLPDERFRYFETGAERREIVGQVDTLTLNEAEQAARAQAALVAPESSLSGRIPRHVDFLELFGVGHVDALTAQIAAAWNDVNPGGGLPHPAAVGRDSLTGALEVDLAENRHGPHGLVAGTTGAGKSEFLQTLICSLVLRHDPRLLNLLLIDFKGGSTFNSFTRLPHTVGIITNLDGTLIERALEALKSELLERQEFLKRMKVRDIAQYHRFFSPTPADIADPSYHPLPHLFVIVDEFAQLAKEFPDFLRELVRIAQVGRSLGLHLILGTQTTEVVTDEMNANLQFKVCFRVQNIDASRAILHAPDAAYLPIGWAGRAYFQVGERGVFKQFQTAYVGGEYRDPIMDQSADDEPLTLELLTDSGEVIDLLAQTRVPLPPSVVSSRFADEPYSMARAVVDVIIDYAQRQGVPFMPPLLLPPLEERSTLRPIFRQAGLGGWDGRGWPENPILGAPIGLIDDIYARSQTPLWIYFRAPDQHPVKDGHVLITGSAGSGKTMALRTLAISLALLHRPDHLHLYFLSFMSGTLTDLGSLPHAEQVVHGMETERVRRLLRRLITTLTDRQSGRISALPAIVVFIDQYEQFRDAYYGQFAAEFDRLVNEGHAVGIYLVITASSINSVPERLRSLIQQRIALQQNNAADYAPTVGALPRPVDSTLPKGRGLVHGTPPLLCQICLPCEYPSDDIPAALVAMRELIRELGASYQQALGKLRSPQPLRPLPAVIPFESLPPIPEERLSTPLGWIDDDALSVFTLDWREHGPHFVAIGPPQSGKSNLLRAAVLSAARQLPPDRLRFVLVDFTTRSLTALAPLKHVAALVDTPTALEAVVTTLEGDLKMTTVLVIDDYDFFSDALISHGPLMRRLRDVVKLHSGGGLHVWAAGYLEHASDPLIKYMLLRRCGFGLMLRESLQAIHLRITQLPVEAMPEGRAFFVRHNSVSIVQTALVSQPEHWVTTINQQWSDHAPATLAVPAAPPVARVTPPPAADLGIDVAGLIDDLFGKSDDDG